jgi:hypothetical protein
MIVRQIVPNDNRSHGGVAPPGDGDGCGSDVGDPHRGLRSFPLVIDIFHWSLSASRSAAPRAVRLRLAGADNEKCQMTNGK